MSAGKKIREERLEKLIDSLRTIMRWLNVAMRAEMEKHRVTWPQFHLMKVVHHHGGMPITALSNHLMISAPTASRMIDGLCSKGLLRKEKDPDDHRVTRVKATVEGLRLEADLDGALRGLVSGLFEGEDVEELERSIGHIARMAGKCSTSEKAGGVR